MTPVKGSPFSPYLRCGFFTNLTGAAGRRADPDATGCPSGCPPESARPAPSAAAASRFRVRRVGFPVPATPRFRRFQLKVLVSRNQQRQHYSGGISGSCTACQPRSSNASSPTGWCENHVEKELDQRSQLPVLRLVQPRQAFRCQFRRRVRVQQGSVDHGGPLQARRAGRECSRRRPLPYCSYPTSPCQ